MISVEFTQAPCKITGVKASDLDKFAPATDRLRQIERASIRHFMQEHAALLKGKTLDFGAGSQPYKDLVTGEYVPHEKEDKIRWEPIYDAVICNQVSQYVDTVAGLIDTCYRMLKPHGHLILTYQTNWAEVEKEDRWRCTRSGMEHHLRHFRFSVKEHVPLSEIVIGGNHLVLSYGAVCVK